MSLLFFSRNEKNNTMKTIPYKMVRLKGETLNQLFSVLEEWNRNLKGCFKESPSSVSLSDSLPESSPNM